MTWAAFKAMVDEYLASQGEGQEVLVYFIDVHLPAPDSVEFDYDHAMGLTIS